MPIEPLEITDTFCAVSFPSITTEPFPNCLSIWLSMDTICRWRSVMSYLRRLQVRSVKVGLNLSFCNLHVVYTRERILPMRIPDDRAHPLLQARSDKMRAWTNPSL